jgi:hypothetical protein
VASGDPALTAAGVLLLAIGTMIDSRSSELGVLASVLVIEITGRPLVKRPPPRKMPFATWKSARMSSNYMGRCTPTAPHGGSGRQARDGTPSSLLRVAIVARAVPSTRGATILPAANEAAEKRSSP